MSATIYELDPNCTPHVSPCQAPLAAPHLSISPRNPALFVNNHVITISLVQLIQGVIDNARLELTTLTTNQNRNTTMCIPAFVV